jgi:hypothetical protein
VAPAGAMRTYLIFGDIEGKLDVLNVECRLGPRDPGLPLPLIVAALAQNPRSGLYPGHRRWRHCRSTRLSDCLSSR